MLRMRWQLEGAAPRRIAVIGRGGAGKTTVALRLGRELGLPVVHLDRLYWGPDWQPVAPHVFGERQAAAIAGDAWVIDGGYLASAGWEARVERADVVVLVEAPLTACLRRILRRSLSRSGRRRPDLPDGCDEAFSLFFLRWTLGWQPSQPGGARPDRTNTSRRARRARADSGHQREPHRRRRPCPRLITRSRPIPSRRSPGCTAPA